MTPIRVIDFSNNPDADREEVKFIEHIKFDDSGDYLYADDDVIKLHSTTDSIVPIVNTKNISALIRALEYLRDKHQ